MTQPHDDPRAAKALHLISQTRHLLDRYERILSMRARILYDHAVDLDAALRAVNVANHWLASGVTLGRFERVPETPEVVPVDGPPGAVSTQTVDRAWRTSPHAEKLDRD